MRQQQEKAIDGFTYKVHQLPATTALRTFVKITKVIGPTLSGIVEAAVKSDKDAKQAVLEVFDNNLTETIAQLFDKIDENELQDMIHLFAEHTFVVVAPNREPQLSGIFEEHFRGRLFSMFKFFAFALKVNYSDFLQGLPVTITENQATDA